MKHIASIHTTTVEEGLKDAAKYDSVAIRTKTSMQGVPYSILLYLLVHDPPLPVNGQQVEQPMDKRNAKT
jgi:hypothetical protein